MVKGRQVVLLVLEFLATTGGLTDVYLFENLSALDYKGDDKLHEFITSFDAMADQIDIKEEQKRNLLLRKISRSPGMKEDLAYYYRLRDDDPDKSYAWARAMIGGNTVSVVHNTTIATIISTNGMFCYA